MILSVIAERQMPVVNDDNSPILTNTTMYLWIALAFAILVTVIEIPLLMLNVVPTALVFAVGWMIICWYTFYRVWRLNAHTLVVNDFDFAKLVAGVFILGASGVLLHLGIQTSYDAEYDNIVWRIKGAFAGNALVALDAATLAVIGTFVAAQINRTLNWLRR
jgi:hypothetical protein